MKPPTRIRDDAPSAHARALLDAARPVRAMTTSERAASAARVARLGAAPSTAPAALWGKAIVGAAAVGVVSTLLSLSGERRPAATPPPRPAPTAPRAPATEPPRAEAPPTAPPPPTPPPPHAARPRARHAPPPPPTPTAPPRPPPSAQAPSAPMALPPPDEPRVTLGAPVRPAAPPAASPRTLDEETRTLIAARASLRSDPAEAARLLREHRARFPDGRLAAERDALLFHALADLGDRAGARDAGGRFLREHPRHPSAGTVRARLEGL